MSPTDNSQLKTLKAEITQAHTAACPTATHNKGDNSVDKPSTTVSTYNDGEITSEEGVSESSAAGEEDEEAIRKPKAASLIKPSSGPAAGTEGGADVVARVTAASKVRAVRQIRK